ncbi:MAG: FHA domain-containing protein [Bdellovibrionales bacterium]
MSSLALQTSNEFYLKAITGKLKGTVFRLSSDEIFIGRDPTNHISIPDDSKLSRRHARLILNKGQYYVQNLSSKNSIKINNETVSQSELRNNYIFTIGNQSFKFISISKDQSVAANERSASQSARKTPQAKTSASNKNIFYAATAILIAAGLYIFTSDPMQQEKKALREIATTEKILERVEKNKTESTELIENIEKSGKNTKEYKSAHSFYIKGMRDFQKGLYAQALSSFDTCLSIYPSHQLARRYSELSTNRLEELIAFNMSQGVTNLENGKNDFCISSFRNVMSQINDKTDTRYIEAKQLLEKCKLLKRSKY